MHDITRRNWARVLYFAAVPVAIFADLWVYGCSYSRLGAMPVDVAIYAVVVYYLTRPDATAYLRPSRAPEDRNQQGSFGFRLAR